MIHAEADVAAAIGWRGARALSPDGRRVGDVSGLILDRQSGKPLWLLVHTRAKGYRATPLVDTIGRKDRVHVPWAAGVVLGSPPVPADGALSVSNEQALCAYYRVPLTRGAKLSAWERRRTTGLGAVAPDGEITWEPGPRYDTHILSGRPGVEPPAARTPRLRVLVADPHIAAVQALREAIEAQPGLQVTQVLRDGPPAIAAVRHDTPDVLVLSLQMQLLGGLEVRDRVHAANHDIVTVLLDYASAGTLQRLDERTMLVSAVAGPEAALDAIGQLTAGRVELGPAAPAPPPDAALLVPAGGPLPAAMQARHTGLPPIVLPPVHESAFGPPALRPRAQWAARPDGEPQRDN
ncbi:hypothetical protein DSM112329_01826 [Paraconexibacter sp. AEG42_29]|uniref:Response regulatory domain-containing protein n=1 Tax=Paraconexibacter sp. AEG42_29 TaxID=2997339 RepID=A0AAU7ATL4_9ACTN